MDESDQRSAHIELQLDDLVQRPIHYQETTSQLKDDEYLVESSAPLDLPKHSSISGHYTMCSGMHETQYLPHLQHKNQVHRIDLKMLDHLDNERCELH